MMNTLKHLQSAVVINAPGNSNEQLQNNIKLSSLGKSIDSKDSLENFSLSNYEDDDEDSGFCCPCCLPR